MADRAVKGVYLLGFGRSRQFKPDKFFDLSTSFMRKVQL